jgi:ribosomal protein S12 methylthiotransferase accessory factor
VIVTDRRHGRSKGGWILRIDCMLVRPSWSAEFHVEVLSHDKVVLIDELNCKVLTGRAFPILAQLLDGTLSVQELDRKLNGKILPPELTYALELGERGQFFVEGQTEDQKLASFWNAAGVGVPVVRQKLEETALELKIVGDITTEPLLHGLQRFNVVLRAKGDFWIVATDDYLRPEIANINRAALAKDVPWMLFRPVGNIVWIGPVFRPNETGCWECLAQRLRGNRIIESFIEKHRGNGTAVRAPTSAVPGMQAMASELASLEIAKALVLESKAPLTGVLLTVDGISLEMRRHVLTRRPQCPVCGVEHAPEEPRPIVLCHSLPQADTDVGARAILPEATYRRLEKHVSPLTGVVRTLDVMDDGADNGLTYSYAAGHNFALMNMDIHFALDNLRCRSGGKGTIEIQAKVSAIAEAIERYSAVYRGDTIERRARYNELRDEALHPNELMLFSDAQYQNRQAWNRSNVSNFHHVPEPFDPDRPIHWTSVRSLVHQEFKWVPSAYCFFGHPDQRDWFFSTSDSNGNAAGNSLEEAILQAFMELIERDAVALMWYNCVRRPGVDLHTCDDRYVHSLEKYYNSIGRRIWALDLTNDFGIPVFAAISARMDGPTADILVGFGAHLSAPAALRRALTEVNQFLPAVIQHDNFGRTKYYYKEPEALAWWQNATLVSESYLVPGDTIPARSLSDFADLSSGDIRGDVETCLNLVRNKGLDLYAINLTQPEIELNVVKVMVPGLRHFWKRFGLGRLYDVPVQLGWIDQPRTEDELNLRGVFF